MTLKKIFCIGGSTIDYTFKPSSELKLGSSNPVHVAKKFGGVARNVAENLSHWTQGVSLFTALGNDPEGQELHHLLNDLNINSDGVLVREARTARYYSSLTQNAELFIAYADMEINDGLSANDLLHFASGWQPNDLIFLDTNFNHEFLEAVIRISADKKCLLCIDTVSQHKANKLPADLQAAFVLKPNLLEAEALLNISIKNLAQAIDAAILLLKRGVLNVVITLGKQGYVLANQAQQKHVPARQNLSVKDVNGAGDAFMAGILYALQQGYEIDDACEYGAFAAQFALQSDSNVAQSVFNNPIDRLLKDSHATIF